MNTITDDQIAEIEALAKLACQYTQPDWFAPSDLSAWFADDDAKFIGFAGPLTVRALITRLREAERDAARYRWLRSRLVGASFDWDEEGTTVLAFEMPPSLSIGADCVRNIDAAMQAAREAAE